MKKIVKKNQIIITALSIMIAVAGYLNFSNKDLPLDGQEANATVVETTEDEPDTKDISEADIDSEKGAKGNSDDAEVSAPVADSVDQKNGDDETQVGEAVLTAANSADFITKAKFNREQTRAKSKDMLMEIIENANVAENQKQDAINQMLQLTNNMETETQTEQLLGAKGFLNSVVSITTDSVDVIINRTELTEVEKAQIEDIVSRKTEMGLDKIVISTLKTQN